MISVDFDDNAAKAAMLGVALTFLINAGAWVWGVAKIRAAVDENQRANQRQSRVLNQHGEAIQELETTMSEVDSRQTRLIKDVSQLRQYHLEPTS